MTYITSGVTPLGGIWRQWNGINTITLFRAISIGPIFWLYTLGENQIVFWLVMFAAASDMEGYLARLHIAWLGGPTEFGARFDPVADKFFVNPLLILALSESVGILFVILALLTLINICYDTDNLYRRRHDLLAGCRGETAVDRLKVTRVSRCKTFVLFATVCWLFTTPSIFAKVNFWLDLGLSLSSDGGILLSVGALLMVSWSWYVNRRDWLAEFFS